MVYYISDDYSLNHYIVSAESETLALQKYFNYFCKKNRDFVKEIQEEDGIVFNFTYYVNIYKPQIKNIDISEVFEIVTYS